jgi:hypothetical protein
MCAYSAGGYDWRRCEAGLNTQPNFLTELGGLDIHFQHVRSPHDDATPLIMTHAWPGSIVEFQKVIGPLTDPTAHGGEEEDAFGCGRQLPPPSAGHSGRLSVAFAI